ncbi:hypothetical protein GOZ98_26480 [Agrobacterium vitis]|nr:hypothetical protein [Agrobacterium vitis]
MPNLQLLPKTFWHKPQCSQTRGINGMEAAHTANELSCSYFLMIQASNEFEEVGAIQDGPGVTKAVWKRNVQHAGELLPYDLIAVGRSSFLPEAALDPPDPDD